MVRHYTAASQGRPKNIASNPGGYTKAFTTRCDPGWSQPSWRFDSVASKKGKIGKGYKSATANLKFFFCLFVFFSALSIIAVSSLHYRLIRYIQHDGLSVYEIKTAVLV